MSEKEHHKGCNCSHEMSDEQLLAAQAEAKVSLAILWIEKDRLNAAEVHLAAASKLFALSGQSDGPSLSSYHNARAAIAQKRGQHKAALRHARKAFAIAKAHNQPDSYRVFLAQANFGECMVLAGKKEKGLQIMSEGLDKLKCADVGKDATMVAWHSNAVAEIAENLAKLR